jgi:hypothetical protein
MNRPPRDWVREYEGRERSSGGHSLSSGQAAYLIETGEFTHESLDSSRAAIARGELAEQERRTRQEGIDASLTTEAVAIRLGVDFADVETRRARGDLFAFVADGETRYPTWQFTDDPQKPVLPGIAQLLPALPDDWHPAGILAFMTTAKSSLRMGDEQVTPQQWLLRGGDPRTLTGILDSFLMS